ncbi:DoxX family protein [Neomicrococcus lactis]|uniref:Putative membrane protein n=1 Tax=Neomicrococcus lactis TaxID=732241 RepID=A0A7W8YD28_9MICC|nr:hypothetical protein [Neomicrococcus lactis]MBB5599340.1 putative membrane protein [Neomicrococcus lactis]
MSTLRSLARVTLGVALLRAGIGHLTTERQEFQAQVPSWVPGSKDTVVLASGVAEIAQGAALIVLPKHQQVVGNVVASFFAAVFPGNIHQYRERINAFGLDTDRKRATRLFFQPVLIWWALASTRKS